MTDETRVKELWSLDDPPTSDPDFVLATLERLARRQLWMDVTRLVPTMIAVGVICAAAAPAIELASDGADFALVTIGLAGLALALLSASDDWRPERFGLPT